MEKFGTWSSRKGSTTGHDRVVSDDPVLERRRAIARWVALGQRVGYGTFGVAVIGFVVGLVAGFGTLGPIVIGLIVVGSVILAPAIVFGYAVRAADRDDRQAGRPTLDDG